MYRINYDDGDREDMEWNELSRLLIGLTAVGTINLGYNAGELLPTVNTSSSSTLRKKSKSILPMW